VEREIVMMEKPLLSLKDLVSMISVLTCMSKTLKIVLETLFVLEKLIHNCFLVHENRGSA
jgi:hypothetical protein